MDFKEMMKQKKMELSMSNAQFAEYIGKHRSWVVALFNPNAIPRPLRETTMYVLHDKLKIPFEVMEEYNREVLESRG